MNEPIFTKRENDRRHYKRMTWKKFLNLVKWAEGVTEHLGYPVYLVGSVLYKKTPRDIDVAIILPLADFEEKYGKLPEKQEDYAVYLRDTQYNTPGFAGFFFDGEDAIDGARLDLKICPDTWFTDRPKLLLSTKGEKNND
jgi:hypothetical protein